MGRPCFLWRNVSFLRMNLDGAAPVRLLWFPWSRVLYEERCAENLLLGPWKSRMDKLYFTSQKSQRAWAWRHAVRIPSLQPNLWCYRNPCQLSSASTATRAIILTGDITACPWKQPRCFDAFPPQQAPVVKSFLHHRVERGSGGIGIFSLPELKGSWRLLQRPFTR